MKYNRFTTIRLAIASLLVTSLFAAGLSSCTREDVNLARDGEGLGAPVAFSVANGSALTKGGEGASEVSYLSSDFFGLAPDGDSLYLNLERTPWKVTESPATKVTPMTNVSDLETTGFGFITYKQPTATSAAGEMTLHPSSATAAYSASYDNLLDYWVPSADILWPNENKFVHFFAYAPYSTELNAKMSIVNGQAPKIVDFTVNADYSAQEDLLVANDVAPDAIPYVVGGTDVLPHQLTFNHALAAIRFKVLKKVGKTIAINEVRIKNVYNKGTYNYGTESWENQSGSESFTLTNPVLETSSRTGEDDYLYFEEEYTLMMIPASQPSSAVIEVDATVNGAARRYSLNISTHTWSQGCYLTYTIDCSEGIAPGYTYYFAATNPTFTVDGGVSDNAKVTSYKYPNGNESAKEPVGWVVEGYYSTQSGAANKTFADRLRKGLNGTFVSDLNPVQGSGSATGEALTIRYPAAVPSSVTTEDPGATYNQTIANTAKKELSGGKAYNLSNPEAPYSDVVKNTANTYIINGAGHYRFPIVMGNGVKDGTLNPTAYNQPGFVDYYNNAITTPYLRGTGTQTPTSAVLIWSDIANMIDVVNPNAPVHGLTNADITNYYLKPDASLGATNGITSTGSGDNIVYWVNFHVPTATKQGVAHIGVRDASGIYMWSWLIWLTDYKLGEGDIAVAPLVNSQDESQGRLSIKLMPRNLGWVEEGVIKTTQYTAATPLYVRLEQSETRDVKVVALTRAGTTKRDITLGHLPFYQWGRVTPIRPTFADAYPAFVDNALKGGFYPILISSPFQSNLGFALRSVQNFLIASTGTTWIPHSSHPFYNLWNANATAFSSMATYTDIKVAKTIYDPCPVGYTVPRQNAFSAFKIGYGTIEGATGNVNAKANGTNFYDAKWVLYTNWRENTSDTPTGNTIEFPLTGRRANSSGAIADALNVQLWTASAISVSNAKPLTLWNTGMVYGYNNLCWGFVIRPQKEEN